MLHAIFTMTDDDSILYGTLLAIYSLKQRILTSKNHWKHNIPKNMFNYFIRYLKGESLADIAYLVNATPTNLARIVLCFHFSMKKILEDAKDLKNEESREENNDTLYPRKNSSELVALAKHLFQKSGNETELITSKVETLAIRCTRDPSLIEDPNLRRQVSECLLIDNGSSPLINRLKSNVGIEYEAILHNKLRSFGITFMGENELRSEGYLKTPDAKLILPIIVDGVPINWIESKTTFGDDLCHSNYLKDQYWCYLNRYGPGLIIYWFGFVQELQETANHQTDFLIMDHFPTNFIKLDDNHSQPGSFQNLS